VRGDVGKHVNERKRIKAYSTTREVWTMRPDELEVSLVGHYAGWHHSPLGVRSVETFPVLFVPGSGKKMR
jgi:hypothetical protein